MPRHNNPSPAPSRITPVSGLVQRRVPRCIPPLATPVPWSHGGPSPRAAVGSELLCPPHWVPALLRPPQSLVPGFNHLPATYAGGSSSFHLPPPRSRRRQRPGFAVGRKPAAEPARSSCGQSKPMAAWVHLGMGWDMDWSSWTLLCFPSLWKAPGCGFILLFGMKLLAFLQKFRAGEIRYDKPPSFRDAKVQ